jgi:c-di-GMP-binding flagellar brake protein YcgR
MDDSFSQILKGFQLPQRGMKDVEGVLMVILGLVVFIVVVHLIQIAMANRKRRRVIRKSAQTSGLSNQELQVLLKAVNVKPKIDPLKVLNSLREFQRLFGPLMHELYEKMESDPTARRQLNLIFSLRKKLFGEVAYHFGPLSTTLQLSIGQHLTLTFDYLGRSITTNSVVLDVDSAAITVANPRYQNKHLRLVKDQPIKVLFYRTKDAEYQFNTVVLRSTEQDNQYFLLLAHDLNIQRIQTRQFYRVTTKIEFQFRRFVWDSQLDTRYLQKAEDKPEEYEGVIKNISAGGMMFSTEAKLEKNDILVFHLELSPELTIPDLLGKVLNIAEPYDRESKYLVHIMFVNIKTDEQDQIIRMILQEKVQKNE